MLQRMHILLQNKKRVLQLFGLSVFNLLLCVVSIKNDLHFFIFDNEFNKNTHELYLVIKCIWLISLFVIEYLVLEIVKHKKVVFQRYGLIFALNTIIYGFFFACLFPGSWGAVGDELLVYWAAKNMWIWSQQGAWSGLVMIWELMFYPATWMPILIQLIFTDLVFSRITGKLWDKGRKATAIIFELMIFSAPAMIYTYNPLRMWIFTVALLAFLAEFYFAWTEKKFSKTQQIYSCFLLCIIVCVRTETKYMLIWTPILLILLLVHCNQICMWKKTVLKIEMVMVLAVTAITLLFENLGGTAYKYNSLSVVSYVCPLSVILTDDNANLDGLEEEINDIDVVFPIQDLVDNPSAINFWNYQHWIDNYEDASKTEIRAFEQAVLRIIIKNVKIFINTRCQMFYACMPNGRMTAAGDTEAIKYWGEHNHSSSCDLYKDFDFKNSFRMTCASILSGISWIPPVIRKIQYSFMIPIMLLILSLIIASVKKRMEIVLILMTVGMEFILLFLLIPSAANMYYIPFYILGWVMMGGYLDLGIQMIRERHNKRLSNSL